METTQLLKGALDLAILAVLSTGDRYGYEIAKHLRDAGLEEIGDASVYGTLRRLESSGALTSYFQESEDGPNRKYYSLTRVGSEDLASAESTWNSFSKTINNLLADANRTKKGA
jgi:PadR family transcriptional regulator PadR